MKRRDFLTLSAGSACALALAACSSSTPKTGAEASAKRREINAGTDATLARLQSQVKGSHELLQKAHGVLVFPNVVSAGVGIGGHHGEGELRSGGKTVGFYETTGGSVGLELGAQSKALIFLFMTDAAYQQFLNSSGWTAGAGAGVALAKTGANGMIDTATAQAPVIGFVLTNSGLMFDLSLEGTKVSKLNI